MARPRRRYLSNRLGNCHPLSPAFRFSQGKSRIHRNLGGRGSICKVSRPGRVGTLCARLPPALFLVPLDDAVILGLLRRRGGLLFALELAAAFQAEPATGSIVVRSPPRCDRRGLLNRQLPMRLPSPFQGAFRASGSGPPLTAGNADGAWVSSLAPFTGLAGSALAVSLAAAANRREAP